MITSWGFARRAARRFVAGETVEEALQAVHQLNLSGINASLDHLGENTQTPEQAREAGAEIVALFGAIRRSGLRANVSIKLSQIGLLVDEGLCRQQLGLILDNACSFGNFVRIDMEDSALTSRTLAVYEWALGQGYADHVGIVLQAYLYRTEQDLSRVLNGGGRVRLCKGAYQEPPSLAFPRKADVDRNYDQLAFQLLQHEPPAKMPLLSGDGRIPPIPALATHDPARIAHARQAVHELNLPRQAVEFQMLYGIRRDLQEVLAKEGYSVRVYVPYGTRWYPYFMRRLAERPANVWFFISNFFRR